MTSMTMRGRASISAILLAAVSAVAAASARPETVVGIESGAGAGSVSDESNRPYLRRQGTGWVWVRRGPERVEILGRAPRPVAAVPITRGRAPSDIFDPWVAYTTGSWPEAVAIGDVNGDGRNDVALVTSFYFNDASDFKLFIFLQRRDGSLALPVKYPTLATHPEPPTTVAIGDVNDDGRNDVVIGNRRQGVGVFLQNPFGRLQPAVLYPTPDSGRVRIAYLNGDGRSDVVTMGPETTTVSVLLQQPNGALGSPVPYVAPHSGGGDLEVGDVNSDGLADVIVMSGQVFAVPNISVLYQQPNGTLGGLTSHFIGTNISSHGIGVGDVDSDDRNDVVVSYGANGSSAHIALLHQQPDGTLGSASSLPSYDLPGPVEVGDVDGDGLSDVIVVHDGWMALGVYLQGSGGQIGSEQLYPLPYASAYNPHGLALGDIDADGAIDVAIADYNYGLVVLRHVRWWVTVIVPNTPLVWQVGSLQTISWTSQLPAGSLVDIAVSRDGGVAWTPIAFAVPDTGSYDWTVTGPPSSQARIRVTWVTGTPDAPARTDMSDVDFTISSAAAGAALFGSSLTPR